MYSVLKLQSSVFTLTHAYLLLYARVCGRNNVKEKRQCEKESQGSLQGQYDRRRLFSYYGEKTNPKCLSSRWSFLQNHPWLVRKWMSSPHLMFPCMTVFGRRHAHPNKAWTFSPPIQTKEKATGSRWRALSIRAPWRHHESVLTATHRHRQTETRAHTPPSRPTWNAAAGQWFSLKAVEGDAVPRTFKARTPCSHDVIPVDSAIREPAGHRRQSTR